MTSRKSQPGFPDLTIVHPRTGRLIFVELKSESGKLSEEQEDWGFALVESDAEYYMWRPSDWLDGTIQNVLQDPKKQRCKKGGAK